MSVSRTATLWRRDDRGLRCARLHTALAVLPVREHAGPLFAFSAMVLARAMRPHTIALTVMRLETP